MYTWDEREAILAEMADVPYERAALEAALKKMAELVEQYGDPDVLSMGEMIAMDLAMLTEKEAERT